ncbi:MAG: hypothetical protein E7614_02005 [Ruminococcaceae bacterium]|nr:hypothetical protein [Oscillospiraceae bacterium]
MGLNLKNKLSPEKFNIIGLLVMLLVISSIATTFDFVLGIICFVSTFISVAISCFVLLWGNKKGVLEYTRSFSEKFAKRSHDVFLVVDEDDRIVWKSGSADSYFNINMPLKPTLAQITSGELSALRLIDYVKANGSEPMILNLDDICFSIVSQAEVINEKKYIFICLSDITELEEAKSLLKSRDLAVAYAMIDNASEAMVYVSEKGRADSLRISSALSSWVQSVNGIIREYDRDKYIIFFEAGQLETLIKDRFSFMDNINTSPADAFEINLTLSLGVAYVEGTLAEKEEAAQSALELALQRGGAQTAVKTKEGTYSFGGRVRSVQKQTKIRSRVVASKLVSLVCNSSNVIIMGHKNADFDSIGSCVGLARLCMHCGVKANIVVNFKDKDAKAAMEHLGDAYSEIFVDSITGQDLIKPETLVIVSDVSNPLIFECSEIVDNAKAFVIIDHHRQTKEFEKKPDISYIEPTASSASELVCEILEHVMPPESTLKEEADLLYTGILLDTQNFSRNTGVRTFGAAIFLNNIGGNMERGRDMLKADASEYKKLASIQSGVTVYKSVYAITVYENDEYSENNRVIAAKAADNLLGIEGIKATFVLTAVDGGVHISARSDGSVNVALLLESIGGGGHFNMAGARLENVSMENAVLELKDAIEKYEK